MRSFALFLAMTASTALAQDASDLEGTWAGTTRFVSYYDDGDGSAADGDPFFAEQTVEIELGENHDGRYFGTLVLQGLPDRNPLVLIVAGDGVTLHSSDVYGTTDGRIIDADHIELCRAVSRDDPLNLYVTCILLQRGGG